jgi:hypothetical protein
LLGASVYVNMTVTGPGTVPALMLNAAHVWPPRICSLFDTLKLDTIALPALEAPSKST